MTNSDGAREIEKVCTGTNWLQCQSTASQARATCRELGQTMLLVHVNWMWWISSRGRITGDQIWKTAKMMQNRVILTSTWDDSMSSENNRNNNICKLCNQILDWFHPSGLDFEILPNKLRLSRRPRDVGITAWSTRMGMLGAMNALG